jgi:hypothetical protein
VHLCKKYAHLPDGRENVLPDKTLQLTCIKAVYPYGSITVFILQSGKEYVHELSGDDRILPIDQPPSGQTANSVWQERDQ